MQVHELEFTIYRVRGQASCTTDTMNRELQQRQM